MKQKIIYLVLALLIGAAGTTNAQSMNWGNSKKENKHIITAHAGWENGLVYSLGYSYRVNERLFPAYVSVDVSAPSGNKLADDFKTRIGGNILWLKHRDFRFSTNLYAVFRRFGNEYARLVNFGSDFSGVIGYYRKRWYVAGEAGFDKAIVTHFRHSEKYKAQYPGVVNGWYEPATGGMFYYGMQAGFSFGRNDLWLKAGKTLAEDFKTKPVVPMYGQLGYNLKF